jgi:hypothetical protein
MSRKTKTVTKTVTILEQWLECNRRGPNCAVEILAEDAKDWARVPGKLFDSTDDDRDYCPPCKSGVFAAVKTFDKR